MRVSGGQDGEATRRLLTCLEAALAAAPACREDLLLVAFSGGPDSTALLLGLARLARRRGWRLLAAHVDHRLDPGSSHRAAAAAALAERLDVEHVILVPGDDDDGDGEAGVSPAAAEPAGGPEALARRRRYRCLERLRGARGARWLLTGHHADDQAETVLLRLLRGSGLAGLAAMGPRRGALLRPLLPLSRADLAGAVAAAGLLPLEDPTNADLAAPRNLLRHVLLPAGGAALRDAALRLASAAAGARRTILDRVSAAAPINTAGGPGVALAALRDLPDELLPWALGELHRRVGLAYPPRATALAELRRQLRAGGRIGCDLAAGWRWESCGGWLRPRPPAPSSEPPAPFAYTLGVPGRVEIREADTSFHLTRQPAASWREPLDSERQGIPERVALDLPIVPGDLVTVRSRRPGDRLQPPGCGSPRRLKEILIDRRVPRHLRDRLPLLCVGEQVAWVPGVTVHHPFRLRPDSAWAWVAELGRQPVEE